MHGEQGDLPQMKDLLRLFPEFFEMATCDCGSANLKYQAVVEALDPRSLHLVMPCEIHKLSAVQTRLFGIVGSMLSGCIAFALGLKGGGSMQEMRRLLKEILMVSVVVRRCSPPPTGHPSVKARSYLLDLFFPDKQTDLQGRQRRVVLESSLHGDPASLWIEYCCSDESPDLDNWAETLATALLPSNFPVFQKGRWMKSVSPVQSLGLLANFHALLPRLMTARDLVAKGKDAGIRPPARLFLQDAPSHDDLAIVVWDPNAADAGQDDELGGNFERQSYKTPEEDWTEYNTRQRGDAVKLGLHQHAPADLGIFCCVCNPCVGLMRRMLDISSRGWARKQVLAARGKDAFVMTRIAWYHTGNVTKPYFGNLADLMHNEKPWAFLRSQDRTWRAFALAFCELSRSGAGVDQMLRMRHDGYPFRLFGILGEDYVNAARRVLADPPCVRCEFTNAFLSTRSTVEALCSPVSRYLLFCVALLVCLDTAAVECRHAALRRLILQSQTNPVGLAKAAASFTLMRCRNQDRGKGCPKLVQPRIQGRGRVRKVALKKKGGGGGVQRAWVNRHLLGKRWKRSERSDVFFRSSCRLPPLGHPGEPSRPRQLAGHSSGSHGCSPCWRHSV